ncbi:hypothetical protein V6N11_011321 [Hibiscus sabdariffa]|uniref:Uncharacterized protein n=1 Tax=Hibiscus sabdariffa TaxID=183260 RepID=A0ABR2S7X7_9ROSI
MYILIRCLVAKKKKRTNVKFTSLRTKAFFLESEIYILGFIAPAYFLEKGASSISVRREVNLMGWCKKYEYGLL